MALFFAFKPVPWPAAAAISAACAAVFAVLLTPLVSPAVLAALQGWSTLIVAFGSRVPQIVLNHRRGNTGELALTTCALNVAGEGPAVTHEPPAEHRGGAHSPQPPLAGNAARVLTTLALTQDGLLLASSVLQLLLNGTLVAQCVHTATHRRGRGAGKVADPPPALQ